MTCILAKSNWLQSRINFAQFMHRPPLGMYSGISHLPSLAETPAFLLVVPIPSITLFHFLTFSKISSRVGAPDKAVSWCSIFSCSFLLGRQRQICSAQHTGQRKFSTEPVGGQQGQVLDVKRVIFHLLLNLSRRFPRIGLIHKTLISPLPANDD